MEKIKKIIISILLACISVFTSISMPIVTVFADEVETEYSNVLTDLQKDESFNVANYPEITDSTNENYGMLSVIQVAESVDNELFIYVYQPSGQNKNLKASSINISLSRSYTIDVSNYKLEYLNSCGVFYKYKVNGLTVKDNETRYYTIVSILRPFDSDIDEQASGDNTITEVVYDVSKEYCFGELNGTPYTNVLEIETIRVTEKFVGYVNYPDGYLLVRNSCHSHFVAFDTDKPIDKLYQAKVYYTSQGYSYAYDKNGLFDITGTTTESYGTILENEVTLDYTEKGEYDSGGLFGNVYTWDRIQTVEDFVNSAEFEDTYHMIGFDITTRSKLTDEAKAELESKKWVLRFLETDYTEYSVSDGAAGTATVRYNYTMVGDVSILELKFETDGIVYQLGVIDNKQTGSNNPINETEISIELVEEWWEKLVALLLLVVLLVILMPILTPILGTVFGLIIKGVGVIIKIVFNIVTFPLRLIGKLFTKK